METRPLTTAVTSVENMDEGEELPTVRKPLHTAAEKIAEMERIIEQHQETVTTLASRMVDCMENQTSAENAIRAIARQCLDNTIKVTTQGTAMKYLQTLTDSIRTHMADVKDRTDSNTRHTAVATHNINLLQADQGAINN